MLRHIPNKYTAAMVLAALDAVPGVAGRLDFFYMPVDARRDANLGFAFVNCVDEAAAAAVVAAFHGSTWPAFHSRKVCAVCPARVQGREALAAHFRGAKFGSGGGGGGRPMVFEVAGAGAGEEPPPPPTGVVAAAAATTTTAAAAAPETPPPPPPSTTAAAATSTPE